MMWQRLDPTLETEEILRLNAFYKNRLVGQERAVSRIRKAYNHALSPIRRGRKPLFAGLFLGPSGVGKTHVAEILAEFFTGDPEGFTKVECASYHDKYMLAQLIGAPSGYVGYYDEPLFSQFKINRPIFEKHKKMLHKIKPDIANLLAQIDQLEEAIREMQKVGENTPVKKIQEAAALRDNMAQKYQQACIQYLGNQRMWSVILLDEIDKAHE
jgi:ATP-dependent Clp protease ATP-binding subunit ClpA